MGENAHLLISPAPARTLRRRRCPSGHIIYWSQDDNGFIAEVPELVGCMAHGDSHESALANVRAAMDAWIETAREFGHPIPEPRGHRLLFA